MRTLKGYIAYLFKILLVTSIVIVSLGTTIANANIDKSLDIITGVGALAQDDGEPDEVDGVAPAHGDDSVNSPPSQTATMTEAHAVLGDREDLYGNPAEKLSSTVLMDGGKSIPTRAINQDSPVISNPDINKIAQERNEKPDSTDAWTNIMSENFEGAFPGPWSVFDVDGATNGEYYWDDDDYKPYAGSWSAWAANGGSDGVDPESFYYANDMKSWMVYGPFDLSDASDAHLQFWYWNQSEENYDYFGWFASGNGTDFDGYQTSGDSGGWNWVDFDLTSVPGGSGDLTGDASVWVAFRFISDYSNVDDGPFVDNVLLEKNTIPPQPNLTPYASGGWDYPIVPSSVSGTTTVNDLYFNQDTYIDWSIINDGAVNISATFTSCLYFDSISRNCWITNGLEIGWNAYVSDWILNLTPTLGWHNLEIVTDVYNDIVESNESDNSWSRDFYWDEFTSVDCDAVTAAFAEKFVVQSSNNPVTTSPSFMPPHPDLWERIQRGEVNLPKFFTDPGAAIDTGINQPGDLEAGPSGTWRAVALLVEFTDNESQVGASNFDTLLFSTGTGTMRDYFNDVSYGTLDIVTVNLPSSLGWCLMPETYAYYTDGQFGTDGAYPNNAQKLAEDAVAVADPYIDFSQYDNDSDGWVDTVFVIHAGSGAEITGSGNDIWSHSWETVNDPVVDGVTVNSYTTEPEFWNTPGDMTMGVYAHELGHVFGLPDLYDTDDSSSGVGRWSLMGSGSWNGTNGDSPAWLDAWSRVELEFLTPVNVTSNRIGESIPAAESDQTVYRLWKNGTMGSEYFLVENRQSIGYDSELPSFGLLIWHIDENKTTNTAECSQNNNWLCGSNHFLVAIEQADGLWELEAKTDGGDTGDPFPGSTTNRTFNWTSTPNSSSYYGSSDTLVQVINISNSGNPMTADLFVADPVEANFDGTPRSGIAPLYVDFTNLSTGDFDTCSWDFGASGSATGCGNPSHQFPNPGNYYVSLTVGGPGGEDTETKTDYITVYEPVTADFSGSPTNGVAPLEVAFTNLSTGDYDTCTWNFGDGSTSYSCGNPSHTYTSDGAYNVSLEVSGPGGLNTELKPGYIEVAAGVQAEFSGAPTSGNAPLTVDFLNLSTGDYNTCSWNFGDGGSSSSCGNPSYTYNDPGAYSVSLTVSGPGGEETEAKVNYVEAYAAVEANFSGTPTSGIGSLTVDFSNWSSGDYDTCLWNFGDGNSSPSCGNPSHTYTTDGVYTVSLQVSGRGGSDTDTKVDYITVYEPAVADFSGTPTNGIAPLDVDFTNLSTGDYDTCSWNFGDGGSSSTCGNPSHTYNSDGVFNVSLTVSGPGGSETETKSGYITVSDQVVSDFSVSTTYGVAPLGVNFTNLSSGDYSTCLWEFGDGGSPSSCGNPGHTYNSDGVYTVSLTVSGSGGSDTETKSDYITVYEPVAADFSASPTNGVAPLGVDFTNLSSGDYNSCFWEFGDGSSSTNCENPSHTYTSDGTYNVSLAVSGAGGSDTETKSSYIIVSGVVTANFSGTPRSGIGSLSVDFTDLSSGDYDTCLWNFGDGNTSSSCGDPSHTYTTDGVYNVSLEVSGSGGSDTETKTGYITVYEPAAAEFSASPKSGSAPLIVSFTNLSAGDYGICSWDFGDGGSSTSCSNPSHTYTNPGVYTVSLTVSGNGGQETEAKADYIVVDIDYRNYIPLIIKG